MVAKAILAILKNSGKAGERVRKFLNKSQDEVEDFVANTLLKKDKRSINEIIKEDGKAGVNKLDDAISSRLTKKVEEPKLKPKKKSGKKTLDQKSTPPFKDKAVRDQWQGGGFWHGVKRDPKAIAALERKAASMRGITVAEFRKLKLEGKLPFAEKPKAPVKKAKGGMMTKWQAKWG